MSNSLKDLFTDHPHAVGETYFEHFGVAMSYSGKLFAASCAAFTHAFLPFLCGRLRALAEWRQLMQARRRLQTYFPSALAEDWGVEPTYWGRRTAFQ